MPLILQEATSPISAVHKKLDEFLREAANSSEPITIENLKEMVETRAKKFLCENDELQAASMEYHRLKNEKQQKLDDINRHMDDAKKAGDKEKLARLEQEKAALHRHDTEIAKAEDKYKSLQRQHASSK